MHFGIINVMLVSRYDMFHNLNVSKVFLGNDTFRVNFSF